MTELNEYQKRCNAEAVEFHDLLQPIVDQMADPWSLQPIQLNDDGHAHRCHYIRNDDTGLEIMARYNEYDIRGKFEFLAVEWPHHTDENGRKCTTGPTECYNPREQRPSTRATAGREPKAIANQIVSKIIPEYERIYARCQGLAADSQKYHDKTKAALDLLTTATGDERHSVGRRKSGWYLRDYPGSQRVEFNSEGDVEIRLGTQDMLEVIDLLYRRNTGKRRDQTGFYACPQCGCTDIEMTAWVSVNSDMPTQDEPPRDDGWCPQCGIDGDGELHKCRFDTVDEPKPFNREGA